MSLEYAPNPIPGARIIYMDASSLTKLHCSRAYKYTVIDGLRADGPPDPILTLGSAVHRFAELVSRGEEDLIAASRARNEFPTVDRSQFVAICSARRGTDIPDAARDRMDEPMIEHYFEFPWLAGVVGDTTFHIYVCGTIDLVAFTRNTIRIIDYKTSRKWKLDDIATQYAHSTQRNFYNWVLHKFGRHVLNHDMANAAESLAITTQICAIQVATKSPRWAMLSPEYMTNYQMTQFEDELREMAEHIVRLHAGDEAYRGGMINGTCTWCRYAGMCYARSVDEHDIVRARFTVREYKPKHHTAPKEGGE